MTVWQWSVERRMEGVRPVLSVFCVNMASGSGAWNLCLSSSACLCVFAGLEKNYAISGACYDLWILWEVMIKFPLLLEVLGEGKEATSIEVCIWLVRALEQCSSVPPALGPRDVERKHDTMSGSRHSQGQGRAGYCLPFLAGTKWMILASGRKPSVWVGNKNKNGEMDLSQLL